MRAARSLLRLGALFFVLSHSTSAGVVPPARPARDWLLPPPHVYVLAIGIDRYANTARLSPLAGCVNDARGIAAAFQRLFNCSSDYVSVLENGEATKDSIRRSLQKWALSAGAQDMFIISFSGWAFTKEMPRGRENYLIPADARADAGCEADPDFKCLYEDSLISASLLYSWMTQVRATRQIILLDSNSTDQAIPLFEEHWRKEACQVGPSAMKRILMVTNHGYGREREFQGGTQGLLTKAVSDALGETSDKGLITAFRVQQAIYRIWEQLNSSLVSSPRPEQVRAELFGGDFVMNGPPGHEADPRQLLLDSGLGPVCYNPDATASRGVGINAEKPEESEASSNAPPINYALVVATDEYSKWPHLSNPVFDAQTIGDELSNRYGFEVEHLFGPSRTELKQKLDALHARRFGSDDQLFIFIAGHGDYDETNDIGYLVFKDSAAGHDYDSEMLLMQLRQMIDTIPAKHILLVMDSCFAGSLDPNIGGPRSRGDYDQIPLEALISRSTVKKTRIFLTSGGKEYVPDGRPGQHSPFAALFVMALQKSDVPGGYLSLAQLPQYFQRLITVAKMGNMGHNEDGSDFFFIPKASSAPDRLPR